MGEPRPKISRIYCASLTRIASEGANVVTEDAGTMKEASCVLSERKLSRRLGCGTITSAAEMPTVYGTYWQQAHHVVLCSW